MAASYQNAEDWLMGRIGEVPSSALGWFRAGVGFYNKKEYNFAIECFQKSIELDPLNYNAFQIMARACIAVNRRDDAIAALKHSVKLDNPSDWQLLIELTAQDPNKSSASSGAAAAPTAGSAGAAAAGSAGAASAFAAMQLQAAGTGKSPVS